MVQKAKCPQLDISPYISTPYRTIYGHIPATYLCKGRLVANSDRLHFEMASAKEGACADKGTRRKVLGELRAVGSVELVVQRKIGRVNLHVGQVVHGHARGVEGGLVAVKQILEFVFNFFGRLAGFGVEADVAGEVERVPGENRVAERRLHRLFWQVDGAAFGLGFTL